MIRLAHTLLLSGLLLTGGPTDIARAQNEPAHLSARAPYADHIAEASQRFGVPVAWIAAVLQAESAGDPRAVSPKGALGLMQLMPDTWAEMRIRHGLGRDPFVPRDNILAGVAYLREMHDRYGSPGFLAAYNAGPTRYEESLDGRPLPTETRSYLVALAPVIGGELPATLSAAAAVDPNAWRRTPLFVERSGRVPVGPRSSSDRRIADRPTAPFARDPATMAPRLTDLFVVRAAARGPQ